MPDEVRDKRQKIESNASTEVIGKGVQKGDSCADIKANQPGEDLSTSSWGDYFRSFFLSSPP